jgi:chemotaxis protein CheX
MDRDLIVNSMSAASTEVIGTMLGLEAQVGPAFTEKSTTVTIEGVLALVGLAGPWVGTGMIICSAELACRISSIMLMADYDAVNGDVLDTMAEIANMIFGNVKTQLEDELGPLGLSIPTVVFGKNFGTKGVGETEWTVVPLHIGGDKMDLKFCIARNEAEHAPRHGFERSYALQPLQA